MSRALVVVLLLCASIAHADPCDDVRAAIKAKELTRASLLLDRCDDAGVGVDLDKALAKHAYARVEVLTKPTGGTVYVDAAEDLPFVTPRTVWLAPGVHDLTGVVDGTPVVRTTLQVDEHSTSAALLELPKPAKDPGVQEVNFAEDGGPPEMTIGAPKDEKFKSLLPDKYLRGIHATGETETAPAPRGELWIGAGYTSRVPGVALGVQPRYRVVGGRAALGVAVDLHVVGGYEDAGYGMLGGGGLVTASYGDRFRALVGAGLGFAFASGTARDAGTLLHAELSSGPYTLVSRFEVAPFDDESVAVLLGYRW